MGTISALEVIGGYKVHPAASLFPLIEGEDFDALVMSIKTVGQTHPIVLKDGMLIDGRNRLRAILELQSNHSSIKILTKELGIDVKSISEYIFDTNIQRRHQTPDQKAMIGFQILPMIQQDREAKQVAAQFKAGDTRQNPGGKLKPVVDTVSHPSQPRDIKQKNEQSTVGQIAKVAKVSQHKARQMVAVAKAIEAGELPKETADKIKSGKTKLKDVVPKRVPKPKSKKAADEPVPDKEKDDAFEDIKKAIDRYLDIDFSSKKLLREKIDTYLISKGN